MCLCSKVYKREGNCLLLIFPLIPFGTVRCPYSLGENEMTEKCQLTEAVHILTSFNKLPSAALGL